MKKRIVLALAIALIVPFAMTGCKKNAEKADEGAEAKACTMEACKTAGKCTCPPKAEAKDDHPKGEHPE